MIPFKKLTCLSLTRGLKPEDQGPVMHIAPTMKNIVHDGKRYFRLDASRRILDDGTECAIYLWDGWADKRLKEIEAARLAGLPASATIEPSVDLGTLARPSHPPK